MSAIPQSSFGPVEESPGGAASNDVSDSAPLQHHTAVAPPSGPQIASGGYERRLSSAESSLPTCVSALWVPGIACGVALRTRCHSERIEESASKGSLRCEAAPRPPPPTAACGDGQRHVMLPIGPVQCDLRIAGRGYRAGMLSFVASGTGPDVEEPPG